MANVTNKDPNSAQAQRTIGKGWQYFTDNVLDGNRGEVYTGNLKYPAQIITLNNGSDEQRFKEAGLFYATDRRYLTRLIGNAPKLLSRLKDAVERLDKLTEDSVTSRGWLEDMQQLIAEIETDEHDGLTG